MNVEVEHWRVTKGAVVSDAGVVAAQHHLAARAGAAVLHDGGNAVDAAVATAFALGVVEPWMCGVGGAGFLVAWLAAERRAVALDFQGVLPEDVRVEDYPLDPAVPPGLMGFAGVRDNRNAEGPLAVLIPGAVAGLAHASRRFGRLDLDRAMAPSLRLLERGLPVDWHATLMIALEAAKLSRDPGARAWFLPGGLPPPPERHLPNPALQATYRAIADEGPQALYGGRRGALLVEDLRALGSRISLDDLAAYRVAEFDAPMAHHRRAAVYTAGPTSGGPRLTDALAHVEAHLDRSAGLGPEAWTVYAEALDHAFRRHEQKLGRAAPTTGCTSHLGVVDRDGNMVALTFTLLNRFGAGVVSPRTGVLMNNAIAYFDPQPGSPTTMRAGLRINASNMCPTVVVGDARARFAVGASGANHIVPCTLQLVSFMLDYGLDLEAAFHSPRIDAAGRDSVRVDPRLGTATIAALRREFATVELAQQLVFPKVYGSPSGVARDPVTGRGVGMTDVSSAVAAAAPAGPMGRLSEDPRPVPRA